MKLTNTLSKLTELTHTKLEKASIPVFTQIMILYTVIVFSIFVLMAYLTITNVKKDLDALTKSELEMTITHTMDYLNEYKQVDNTMLIKAPPLPSTYIQVYDKDGKLVLNNLVVAQTDKYLTHLEEPGTLVDGKIIKSSTDTGIPVFLQTHHFTDRFGDTYTIRFSIITVKEHLFNSMLQNQFIIAVAIGLLLALIVGITLAYVWLKPLSRMMETLGEIDFNHLERRVTVPERKDEVHYLAISVNNTLDRLQMGADLQKQFINDASHELRTPVTVIQGYADMLLRWGREDLETLDEGLQAISQETQYMNKLIENLLFLARSAQGRLEIKKHIIEVSDLLTNVYESEKLIVSDQEFILEKPEPSFIYGDYTLLLQLIRIFIENSIKYTPKGGKICLSSQKTNDAITISIKDTGIGIAPEYQDRIFERFYRVDESRTKDTGGNGLGLSIAAQIIKIHNATIKVDSNLGQGTTMTVIFPEYIAPDLLDDNSTSLEDIELPASQEQ